MDWSSLVSHAGSRWALPLAWFCFVYGPFAFLDRHVSPEFRTRVGQFLKDREYRPYLGRLPEIVDTAFTRVFGEKHLSARCIGMSFLLSAVSLAATFAFTELYVPHGITDAFSGYGKEIRAALEALIANPQVSDAIKETARSALHRGPKTVAVLLLAGWLAWCVFPDYLALLKTRIVILVLKNTKPKVGSLITLVFVDVIIGTWLFVTSLLVPQTAAFLFYAVRYTSNMNITSISGVLVEAIIVSAILFAFEGIVLSSNANIYTGFPFANLFWASMVPSVWFWAYVFSALATRTLLASAPVLDGAFRILDVTEHPIRTLGFVAGIVAGLLQTLVLIALSFI